MRSCLYPEACSPLTLPSSDTPGAAPEDPVAMGGLAPYLPGSRTGPGHRVPSRSVRGSGPRAQSQCPAAPPARTGKKSGSWLSQL